MLELAAMAFALSGLFVIVFAKWAPLTGLLDTPGGRKEHSHAVPLVGGLAIYLALLATALISGAALGSRYFLLALALVMAVGVLDDVKEVRPRLKFLVQALACFTMIWGAEVELHSVGDLFGLRPIGLSIFVVPMTIFAVIGVVNSINMTDGIDGLAGSISATAFAWYAAVAWWSGLAQPFIIAVMLAGAIAGFLLFNLRFPWQPHARVFLGDAGSLMIGFALAWFAIDLSQGHGRTFPPIAALWVVLLPLADCVSLMARRLKLGRSPFVADRRHIHHYLLARGFTHAQAVAILVGASTLFGAVGFFGWQLRLPELALFWPFFVGFFVYHQWIKRAWDRLEVRDRVPARETGAFVANALSEQEEEVIAG